MGFFGILLPNNVTAMPTEPERPDCEDYQNEIDCITDKNCLWFEGLDVCIHKDPDQSSFFKNLKNQTFESPEAPPLSYP